MDAGSVASSRFHEEHQSVASTYADDILGNVLSNLDNLAIGAPSSPARDVPDLVEGIFRDAIRSNSPVGGKAGARAVAAPAPSGQGVGDSTARKLLSDVNGEGEEAMPSGEEASSAVVKLQARMRGNSVRETAATKKQPTREEEEEQQRRSDAAVAVAVVPPVAVILADDDGYGEGEEAMPSGEEASSAAVKLQARMRGNSAREAAATKKQPTREEEEEQQQRMGPKAGDSAAAAAATAAAPSRASKRGATSAPASPPVSPERVQQIYQGRVDRVTNEITNEDNSTSLELSEARVDSVSAVSAASVARMQKIYKSREARVERAREGGDGDGSQDLEQEAAAEEDEQNGLLSLYQRRLNHSEKKAVEAEMLSYSMASGGGAGLGESGAPAATTQRKSALGGMGMDGVDGADADAAIYASPDRMRAIYLARSARVDNANGSAEASQLSGSGDNDDDNDDDDPAATAADVEAEAAVAATYEAPAASAAEAVLGQQRPGDSDGEGGGFEDDFEQDEDEDARSVHLDAHETLEAAMATPEDLALMGLSPDGVTPLAQGHHHHHHHHHHHEGPEEEPKQPESTASALAATTAAAVAPSATTATTTAAAPGTTTLLATPGPLFLSPRPIPARFLRTLRSLRLPGVEAWVSAEVSEGGGGGVQFLVQCRLAPGSAVRSICRAVLQQLDDEELEWIEEMRGGAGAAVGAALLAAPVAPEVTASTTSAAEAAALAAEAAAAAAATRPRSSSRSRNSKGGSMKGDSVTNNSTTHDGGFSADGSRSRAASANAGGASAATPPATPGGSSKGAKSGGGSGGDGRALTNLDKVRPTWPNPGSKHPGVPTEWDAPSPRTPSGRLSTAAVPGSGGVAAGANFGSSAVAGVAGGAGIGGGGGGGRKRAKQRPKSAGPSAGGRVRPRVRSSSNNNNNDGNDGNGYMDGAAPRATTQRPQSASSSSTRQQRQQQRFSSPWAGRGGAAEDIVMAGTGGAGGISGRGALSFPPEVIGLFEGEYPERRSRPRPQSARARGARDVAREDREAREKVDALRGRPTWNGRFHLDIKAEQGLRFASRNGQTVPVRPHFDPMSLSRLGGGGGGGGSATRMEVALNIANDLSPSWRKHVLVERVVSGGRVRISEMLATQPYEDDRDAMPCSRGFLVEKIVNHDKGPGTGGGADASELMLDKETGDAQTTVSSFHMPVSHLRAVAKILEDRVSSRALGKDRIVCCRSKDGFELSPPLHQLLPRMDLDSVLDLVLMATEDESLRVLMAGRSKEQGKQQGQSTPAGAGGGAAATPKAKASQQPQQDHPANDAGAPTTPMSGSRGGTRRTPTRPTSATPTGRRRRTAANGYPSGGRQLSAGSAPSSSAGVRTRRGKSATSKKSKSVRDAENIYSQPYPGHDIVDALPT